MSDEILSDELVEEMPKAATILVFREDGKVLGVSRPDDPTAFTLPGGKVEDGETVESAAKRELQEETGLKASNLVQVYEAVNDGYLCTTFEADVEGELGSDEDGRIKWCRPSELAYGPFGEYNQALFDQVGIQY